MKRSTLALIAVVLLTIGAVPAFGLACTSCQTDGTCAASPESGTRCRFNIDTCFDVIANCSPLMEPALATEWSVASVEVKQTTPKGQQVTRTIQTAVPVRAALK